MPSLRSARAPVVQVGRHAVVRFGRLSSVQVGRHSVVQFKPSNDTELIGLTLHRFAPWYGVDRHLGRLLPGRVDYLSGPLWADIGGDGNTRAAAAVCPECWGERTVILVPWWLHHLTACPWHGVLLRERCAECDGPLRLVAGREGCEQCGAAIAAMGTRSIAGDADGVELSGLVWRATGCVEGLGPLERAGQLLPLLERTADEIEAWARRQPEQR